MKTYLVGLNFMDNIEAESEEMAILEFSEKYRIREKYLFAQEQVEESEEDNNEQG